MSNNKDIHRPLYARAKFAGPFWCGIGVVGVYIYAMIVMPDLDAEHLKAVTTVVTSTITALLALGVIIGGGASAHDAARDWGSRGNLDDK